MIQHILIACQMLSCARDRMYDTWIYRLEGRKHLVAYAIARVVHTYICFVGPKLQTALATVGFYFLARNAKHVTEQERRQGDWATGRRGDIARSPPLTLAASVRQSPECVRSNDWSHRSQSTHSRAASQTHQERLGLIGHCMSHGD